MSYWVHECGNQNNSLWRYFQCDYLSDIKKLPTATKEGISQINDTVSKNKCSPGSKCLCQEDGSLWFLGKDTDRWIKLNLNISSGSSGTTTNPSGNIESIPLSYIESLFPTNSIHQKQ